MFNLLFSSDPKQSLRMLRHLAAVMSMLAFTLLSIFFFIRTFSIDEKTFTIILFFLVVYYTYHNNSQWFKQKISDPSLTIPQMVWGRFFY